MSELRSQFLQAAIIFALILNVLFFPVIWGDRTLVMATYVTSILPDGAYGSKNRLTDAVNNRTLDGGASTWQSEPWFKVVSEQYFTEHVVPLWNQYAGFGAPLLANMQSQPFSIPTFVAFLFPNQRGLDLFVLGRLFIAGLLMFLFLRLFLPTSASIFGGVSFMLSGFFLLYITHPDLSVSIWLPLVMYAVEQLVRSPRPLWLATTAVAVALTLLGGMPEIAFLVLVFAAAYFVFRIFSDESFSTKERFLQMGWFAAACALGFSLAAPLLLPFFEYVRSSYNIHSTADSWLSVACDKESWVAWPTYLLPFCYGPLLGSIVQGLVAFNGVRGSFGFCAALLSCIALAGIFALWHSKDVDRRIPRISAFFAVCAAFFFLKRIGSPLVSWVGTLPLAKMVYFLKFEELLIAFCIASLSAIGLSLLSSGKIGRKAVFLATGGFALLYWFLSSQALSHAAALYLDSWALTRALTKGAMVVALLSGIVIATLFVRQRRLSPVILIVFLCAETFFNLLKPAFYGAFGLPGRNVDPYKGAPYITFLNKHLRDRERIYACDDILYPNWADAFDLYDVRDVDALFTANYLPFVRNFFLGDPSPAKTNDYVKLRASFTGNGEALQANLYDLANPDSLIRRFFALSSVRYMISSPFMFSATGEMLEILRQNKGRVNYDFHLQPLTPLTPDKGEQPILVQVPAKGISAKNGLRYEVQVPSKSPILSFQIGMAPFASAHAHSDGAAFLVDLQTGSGKRDNLFSKYISPKEKSAEGFGLPNYVDLSAYAGKRVTLWFSTSAGPRGDNYQDNCAWKALSWVSDTKSGAALKAPRLLPSVYEEEVVIHEFPDALPRAAFFSEAKLTRDTDQSLEMLRDPSFNIWRTVTLLKDQLSDAEIKQMLASRGAKSEGERCIPLSVKKYSSQQVVIELNCPHSGIVMLNDTDYPGWSAYVDGKARPIKLADALFRGVLVNPGEHELIFRYEPWTFNLGLLLAALAALLLALSFLVERRKNEQKPAFPPGERLNAPEPDVANRAGP